MPVHTSELSQASEPKREGGVLVAFMRCEVRGSFFRKSLPGVRVHVPALLPHRNFCGVTRSILDITLNHPPSQACKTRKVVHLSADYDFLFKPAALLEENALQLTASFILQSLACKTSAAFIHWLQLPL
jgi:hypothetical protein